MSADKPIPERHRAEYESYCEEGSWEAQVVEELGTAESLVGELQAQLCTAKETIIQQKYLMGLGAKELEKHVAALNTVDDLSVQVAQLTATISQLRKDNEALTNWVMFQTIEIAKSRANITP